MKYQLVNEEIAIQYNEKIKKYLESVLIQNKINKTSQEIEDIYNNMLAYIKDGTAKIIAAFESDKILGFIWVYERMVNQETRYHINYFIVDEKSRKKGIGTHLMEEVYNIARTNGIKKIELMVTASNENAVEFYKKQNFNTERIMLCKEI